MKADGPRLLLFDIDGTLVSAAGAGRAALAEAFARVLRIDPKRFRQARVPFDGNTDPTILRALASAVDVAPADLEARMNGLLDSYFEALRREMGADHPDRRVLPGVLPLLRHLRSRPGVHLGLVTGNLEISARIKLEPFGLNDFFPHGGFGSDHPDRAEIARIATERCSRAGGVRFAQERVVVIGDTEKDVRCARDNGYRAVALGTGWTDRARLEQAAPDAYLDDLSDLDATLVALEMRTPSI